MAGLLLQTTMEDPMSYIHTRTALNGFELYREISHASQVALGLSVADFFGYLQIRWEELAQYEPLSDFPTDAAVESKRLDRRHTYQFLMGLKPEFEALWAQILNTSPMPSLYEAFATVDGDERRCRALPLPPPLELSPSVLDQMAFAAPSGSCPAGNRPYCQHCRKLGHVIDCCFDLHPELKQRYSRNLDQGNKDRGKWAPRIGVTAEVALAPSISDYCQLQSQIAQLQSPLGLGLASLLTILSASSTATLATAEEYKRVETIFSERSARAPRGTPSLLGPVEETRLEDSPLLPCPAPLLEPPLVFSPSLTSRSLPPVITTDPFPYVPCCPRSNITRRLRTLVPPPDFSPDSGTSSLSLAYDIAPPRAPNVYFEDDTAINLETELARSRRIKCSCCGIKGAALGCYEKSCRKSFHIPCAKMVHQCRWDTDNFVILCPLHSSSKLPSEIPGPQGERRKRRKGESHTQQAQGVTKHGACASRPWKCPVSPNKWVFCCSALTIAEKETVSEFVRLAGVTVSKTWNSNVTHVIASTDENGACRRTFKFLIGILEGKWILKIDWITACMKAMEPVNEEQYEISVDTHGIRDGPRLGRLRTLNKQPKLFSGFKFYFTGEFVPSYKGYLQDLVVAAGGTVLQRKPISGDQGMLLCGSSTSTVFIIYSLELPDKCDSGKKAGIFKHRQADAEALASLTGTKVAGHSWVLDSIAACKLQNLVQ
ncbi:hypothetical protein HHK36_004876 [Tetracentron sinense]|uniref:Uncharacterized protein n=1 Tax=Tetracentron sinense TaxID=13715 RepID=A0A834ZM37_TETSI|nr:hypothetical protein HHK36_004876 [Tetracentron sinense]